MKESPILIKRGFITGDGAFSLLGCWGYPVCMAHEAATFTGPRKSLRMALTVGQYQARRIDGGNQWAIVDGNDEPLALLHGADPFAVGGISLGHRLGWRAGRVRLLNATEALATLNTKLQKVERVAVIITN